MLLRKGVYPCKFMDGWEKFHEKSLPKKEEFCSNLNIINSDYNHAKRICKDFEIRNLGEYHDLYLKSNTLSLADIFENSRKI